MCANTYSGVKIVLTKVLYMNITRSTLIHLRIPFSVFLMPIYWFALSLSPSAALWPAVLVFVVLHLLLYPASNGYNSWFDKDEGSIGGVERPPSVTIDLYYVSLLFDALALALGFVIGWQFVVLLFVYGLVSKMYSHPAVRLKKMPIIGWLAAGIFQGAFTYVMVFMAVNGVDATVVLDPKVALPAALSTFMLFGSYPMTQVYQHEEDGRRGDETLSRKLGLLGTFHFTALMFTGATAGFCWYYAHYYSLTTALLFVLFLGPVLAYFGRWYLRVRRNAAEANFKNTMRLNIVSSLCLSAFFIFFMLMRF